MKIEKDISLKKYNTWKVGGDAEYFSLPDSIDEVRDAQAFALKKNLDIRVLGSGSNVLIPDEGIKGLVICTKKLKGMKILKDESHLFVESMAGEPKFLLMKAFLKENLPPAIFLSGLPGDVGGGIVMNAGVSEKLKPREFVEITDWVEVMREGEILRYDKKDLQWDYRYLSGWQPGIIVRAGFSWPLSDVDKDLKKKAKEFSKTRWDRQPLDQPTCGSTFVNPKGHSAGFLIEDSGLKGFEMGGAKVSEKHANFIENTGEASAKDISNLIEHIILTVEKKHGIRLKPEVQFL